MKTKIIFIILGIFLLTACCEKEVPTPPDPYASFKADATLRIEEGNKVQKCVDTDLVFYSDKGILFGSKNHKVGFATSDGSKYTFIEWKTKRIWTENGVRKKFVLFEKKKETDDLIWIVYQETESSPLIKVVLRHF